MTEKTYSIEQFPPRVDLQTVPVLQKLSQARAALGEMKGRATSLPNEAILLDTLSLQEALASSEIENIVTTQDEVFRVDLVADTGSVEAKEVARYRDAMRRGYEQWRKNRFISENMLIDMFRLLKQRDEGYRRIPVAVRNMQTGEDIYMPPPNGRAIEMYMRDLANFINDPAPEDMDPLVKMALIHHQFESIHPFSDGNGRVGRMLNVLYLTHAGLLDTPILYLSRAINRTKPDYYRLLQAVREQGAWEAWVIYILSAVHETASLTLRLISGIRDLMSEHKIRMRDELPKIYSQDLLNNLFRHPYTRIEYVANDLDIRRQTARKYLKQLTAHHFVNEIKSGRNNYYVNEQLVALFVNVSAEEKPAETESKSATRTGASG